MNRPRVLLALDGRRMSYEDALTDAGFEVFDVDHEEALSRLSSDAPFDLAVLDCDRGALGDEELFGFLHGTLAVPTIILFSDDIPEWAVDSAAGPVTDEYARKPLPPEALVYRLQALLIRAGREVPGVTGGEQAATSDTEVIGEGTVVSLFAPKGGVGKTMIAINLAVALREQTGDSVCLLDADVGVGNVTAMLSAPYRGGLADLADSPPGEWTDAAFDQTVTTHEASGVRILSWGNEPSESTRIGTDLLVAAVRWARTHHAWVIIDCHPSYDDRTMAMLAASREIFLVVTPEVGSLRNAAQFLSLAREVGLGDLVRVIVNRANHGISLDVIAQTLGTRISATVVSNGPRAIAAANEGTPLITKFPREQITTDLHNVARLLSRPDPVGIPARRRPWWTALVPRSSEAWGKGTTR